jgi:hypothetical protein
MVSLRMRSLYMTKPRTLCSICPECKPLYSIKRTYSNETCVKGKNAYSTLSNGVKMDKNWLLTFEHTVISYLNLYSKRLKGIVSRDFVVCFLVSFDRSHISTHQERVLLLLKVRFCIEFFDFRVRP